MTRLANYGLVYDNMPNVENEILSVIEKRFFRIQALNEEIDQTVIDPLRSQHYIHLVLRVSPHSERIKKFCESAKITYEGGDAPTPEFIAKADKIFVFWDGFNKSTYDFVADCMSAGKPPVIVLGGERKISKKYWALAAYLRGLGERFVFAD